MSNVEKIIDKMKRRPNGIRPEEAEKVLKNGSKGLYEITIYQVGAGNE